MEAEHLHGADQSAQAALGQWAAAMRGQRVGHDLQIGTQAGAIGIGCGGAYGMPLCFVLVDALGGGREARVDAGQGAAVRLVAAVLRVVGRAPGQTLQLGADHDQQVGQRQFDAQGVHFGEVEIERRARLQAQPFAQDLGGDEGVAVAVAADPAADAEEVRQLPVLLGEARL